MDHDDPSPQTRRLRLRNSLVRPSRLSYGPTTTSPSPPPSPRAPSPHPHIDDNGWETEDAERAPTPPPPPPPLTPNEESENTSNTARKRRSRDAPFLPPALLGLSPSAVGPQFTGGGGVNGNNAHRRNRSGSESAARADGNVRYVDFLERQVSELSAQLAAHTGPSGNSKLRRLSNEARGLRNEVLDWEAKFNVRVAEEVALKASRDDSLRTRIRGLEESLEETLERGREVEEECEVWRGRVLELEGVKKALEVRVEALSSMLADATRRGRSGSRGASRGVSICSRGVKGREMESQGMERCVTIGTATTPGASRRGSVDDDIGVSAVAASPGSSPGRRLEDYGITDPIDTVLLNMTAAGEPARPKLMRRFPSGSSAPKALVLPPSSPTTTTTPPPDLPPAETSPTLPTLTGFFNTPIADPSSMFSPHSRPSTSSSSASTSTSSPNEPPVAASAATARPPLEPSDSLFAELARAENEAAEDEEEDAFALVSEAMSNPTPLLLKAVNMVGNGIRSPTGTFLTARKSAMDLLAGVVGRGVERVTRRRARMLQTRQGRGWEARRRIEDRGWEGASMYSGKRQDDGGKHRRAASVELVKAGGEDAVEHVWLWVRFMVALVVALGVAVKEGPGVVLAVDGGDYDGVVESEREVALRELEGKRGRGRRSGREETRAERMRREWRGMGDERLRLWEGGGKGVGGRVGDGRRKAMEWGV